MNRSRLLQLAISGVAIASYSVALTSCAHNAADEAKGNVGACQGVNTCKGTADCGGKSNACKGQNECKGKGWLKMNKFECDEKGGKFGDPM